ncbi:polyisoprenoid-binding protein [Pseudomonas jessenii]|jgi:polyisoprenoid-binding protein YceI|uniref:Polyisoprenoid-binding protein n=1 Tax=Pseudomonas jessenii TaxID=77298 RepID=A0A2W0EKD6_PSEJE|nr:MULTISPECIES: YceI family protein [Pseudomonas]PYY68496.1 polyisoprenoid-binding protein [Pseudomonas jessenii]WPN28131.1 YceI family protein [Pseudomonas sp. P5_109]
MNLRSARCVALAGTLVFGLVPFAEAVEYKEVNAKASTLSFTYQQMGTKNYGTFGKFEARLDFDTDNPSAAHAALTIDLKSIEAGSNDSNTELQKPAWFDTATYPVATFESTSIKALGDNRYTITGKLSLRGLTREVSVPVQLKSESSIGIFVGDLVLKRDDFKIGEGELADSMVSNEIKIRFRMVAPQR